MATTLNDVAQEAGVSASTVSRTFSGGLVSASARQRVLSAADKLGYQPNRAARALSKGKTGNIGLILPDLSNPFFSRIIKGVSEIVRDSEYHLLVVDSDEDRALEREGISALRGATDGLLIVSPRCPDEELLNEINGFAAVVVNRVVPGVACTGADPREGMKQAVTHLMALGHSRIAYVSGPEKSWSEQGRRTAMNEAAANGIQVSTIESASPTFTAGVAAGDLVLATDATAVIAFNDLLALGVLNRLTARGISVPNEISIIGNDDIEIANMVRPALTTVGTPQAKIGRTAIGMLLRTLSRENQPPEDPVILPSALVVRESTGLVRT